MDYYRNTLEDETLRIMTSPPDHEHFLARKIYSVILLPTKLSDGEFLAL